MVLPMQLLLSPQRVEAVGVQLLAVLEDSPLMVSERLNIVEETAVMSLEVTAEEVEAQRGLMVMGELEEMQMVRQEELEVQEIMVLEVREVLEGVVEDMVLWEELELNTTDPMVLAEVEVETRLVLMRLREPVVRMVLEAVEEVMPHLTQEPERMV